MQETNDVALPAAAIELVMPVKDDVFRPFDGTEADQFDIVQTIVNGVRPARAFRSRRAGRQTEIGWRHIDLGEQLVWCLSQRMSVKTAISRIAPSTIISRR